MEDDRRADRKAGQTWGRFIDACTTIPTVISGAALGQRGRPYVLDPKGRKSENDTKKMLCEELIDTVARRKILGERAGRHERYGHAEEREGECGGAGRAAGAAAGAPFPAGFRPGA